MKNTPTKKFHPDFIEEVNQRTDLVDIISGHIELKKRGKEYLGLCPFHDEKTPSFSVSPTKKLAYCFGCSWGGNAIKFLMELNRVSFVDAILDLARSANIPVRYEDGSTEYDYPDPLPRPLTPKPLPAKEEKENSDKKDYTVDEWRVNRSVERLLSGTGDAAKALGWLFNRGITHEMVERYRLGLEKRVVTPDESDPERKETYWALAIFIPVPNRPGRFYIKKRVAPWLSGADRPNYLGKWAQFGVPATIWFTYNPDDAHETWFAEGEWDAIRLAEQARTRGEKAAVACSTSGAGTVPKQEELNRLPGQVIIFYDRDKAGEEGSQKLAEALPERGRIALVPMPDNCQVKGWDISNALDAGYTWDDFKAAASSASSYTPSIQELDACPERTISRDEWELTFGFGKRLRNRIKQALDGFKGFGKQQSHLPRPKEAPNALFQDANQRLTTWQDAATQGYQYILDKSAPSLGKSHAAGIALPDAFAVEKLWYISTDHRNPTTGVIESNYVDLPVRHKGLKVDESRRTPHGRPFLVWPRAGEEPDTQGNCFRTDLFQKFRAKNLNVEASLSSPICQKACKVAHLCKSGSGGKYAATFRGDRQNALASNRIRAHADSLPSPQDFDYSTSGLIWDEIGIQLKPMESVSVTLADFDQVWGELEMKAPSLHKALKPLRLALRPLLTGDVKQPYHGWDDAGIRALLPQKPDNLAFIIDELETILQPDLSFLNQQADRITASEAKKLGISQSAQALANREFRRQNHEDFSEGFQKLALNWLVPFLGVWAGERGALRGERQQLIIFTHSERHAAVARTAKFNIFLDATITREKLALLLGINPEEIYVVEQEIPNHGNLKIIQITGMGKLGKERSESLQNRVAALRKALEERYPGIVFGDWKTHASSGDGQWFVNLRGSNEFQNASALCAIGIPYQNVGHLQALYQTLTGDYAPLDQENPQSGLQRFIEAHVQAEIEQAAGRLRSHIRPNEQLTFIFVGDYDLSFLGMPVEQITAFELCDEAGTLRQKTRWAIWQAYVQLRQQLKDPTEIGLNQLARGVGITKGRLSQIAKEFFGWSGLQRCLDLLFNSLYNNPKHPLLVDEDVYWLAQDYLPLILELPPLEALLEVAMLIRTQNLEGFKQILAVAMEETKSKLLSAFLALMPMEVMSGSWKPLGFSSE